MNTAGISHTPPPPAPPVVAPVSPTTTMSTHPGEHERHSEDKNREEHRRTALEAPKMRPLSTTEVRVMLGMAPPEALRVEREQEQFKALRGGHFDSYA